MSAAAAACPQCGHPATGNFCASCGAGLSSAPCSSCGTAVAPGAAFCHRCGQAMGHAQGMAGPRPVGATATNPAAWWVAGLLVMVSISGVVYSLRGRQAPPAANMPNEGNASPLAGVQAPDITSMSPTEQFTRLHNRIVDAADKGDSNTVVNFWPMAMGAYQNLSDAERTIDVRYQMATLYLVMPLFPQARALADTILKQSPNNLIGYYLRSLADGGAGNTGAAKASQDLFVKHYPTEITKSNPEYVAHRPLLDAWFQKGGGK